MRIRIPVSATARTAAASSEVLSGAMALEVTPALTVLDGPAPGTVFRLAASGKRAFVAGRASDADISLADATVSRHHARFWLNPGESELVATVEDLRSTNGTYVNGERAARASLGRGDRVVLGSVVLRFDLLDPVEVRVTEELEERLRSATLDPLTGLETRRAVGELTGPAAGPSGPIAAIMVDLDHFKRVNDEHGHAAGDAVLRLAASALKSSLRGGDLAIRWGGEEFLALLPGTDPDAVSAVADRILRTIRNQDVAAVTPGKGLSASLGVACARPPESLASLIERADRALYRAKHAGRGRIELAE